MTDIVESDYPKFSEADIPASFTDSLFRKSPQSVKAENRPDAVLLLTFCYWHISAG